MPTPIDGTERPPLGTCPDCGEPIPQGNPVVRYDPAEGWPRMVAQCPGCDAAVRPT